MKGFEGIYTIDKSGNIFDIEKNIFINQYPHTNGYKCVCLRKTEKSKRSKLVHRLIAESYLPNPKNLPCINHINGIKTDNRLENLEWCTYSENNKHAFDTGLKRSCDRYYPKGENHPRAKINPEKAKEIRKLCNEKGLAQIDVAAMFGVCTQVVYKIIRNKTWVLNA